jgi:hypothetical protein
MEEVKRKIKSDREKEIKRERKRQCCAVLDFYSRPT